MAKDISAVGAKIAFSGGTGNFTIDEFSDEGTPFDCPDIDVSTNAKNLNGEMISSRTPSVVPFSVTVIPGTLADEKLWKFFRKSLINPGSSDISNQVGVSNLYCTAVISIPTIYANGSNTATAGQARTYTFNNCRAKSGPTGPSTSADGRLAARTYSFECESYEGNI